MKSGVLGAFSALFAATAMAVAAPVDSVRGVPVVRPASTVLLPVASVFVPGFGQAAQRRYAEGGAYFAAGVSGLVLMANSGYDGDGDIDDLLFDRKGARRLFYGSALYQGAGFLSAWDAFQAAIPAQQQDKGRFRFLKPAERESVGDLLLAPFNPTYLARPTTWIPLGVLGGLAALSVGAYRAHGPAEGGRWTRYGAGEVAGAEAARRPGADHDDVVGGGDHAVLPATGQWKSAGVFGARIPFSSPCGARFSIDSAPTGQKRTQMVQ